MDSFAENVQFAGEIMPKENQLAMKYVETLHRHLTGSAGGAKLLAHWFTRGMARAVAQRGVEPDPLLLLLAEDVLAHCLLVREAHRALQPDDPATPPGAPPCNGKRKMSPAADTREPDAKTAQASLDNVMKYREKLRKSVGDLQAMLAAQGAPAPAGLAALFPELDAQLDGVMSAAEAYRQLDARLAPPHPGRPLKGVRPDLQAVAPGCCEPAVAVADATAAPREED